MKPKPEYCTKVLAKHILSSVFWGKNDIISKSFVIAEVGMQREILNKVYDLSMHGLEFFPKDIENDVIEAIWNMIPKKNRR